MSYQLLIFDFDGTLANTREAVFRSMSKTLGELLGGGETITTEQIEAVVATGATLPDAFGLLLADKLQQAERKIDLAVARYRAIYAEHADEWSTLYPGVAPFLKAALANEVALVVVSNKGEPALRASLGALGIAGHFALILGEQAGLRPKPAPDIFDHRIVPAFADIPRNEMLFVGDTPADLEFANSVGIDACWAAHGHGDEKACRLLDPVSVIDGFDELAKFVGLKVCAA
jgi:phosphoglycolate phosphatase